MTYGAFACFANQIVAIVTDILNHTCLGLNVEIIANHPNKLNQITPSA